MNSKLLIFDLDGTLIDSRADLVEGINHMRWHCGLSPLDFETVGGDIGRGIRQLVERSLEGAVVDIEEALQLCKDYYLSNLTVHTTLYDGVEEGIPRLAAAGHKLALLTNKPGDPSREILNCFGLDKYFHFIIGGGGIHPLKPAPDGIFQCMTWTAMEPSNTWMVGDHYADLIAAENAGISSAFVHYGFGEAQGHKPTLYFSSFPELVEYFV